MKKSIIINDQKIIYHIEHRPSWPSSPNDTEEERPVIIIDSGEGDLEEIEEAIMEQEYYDREMAGIDL